MYNKNSEYGHERGTIVKGIVCIFFLAVALFLSGCATPRAFVDRTAEGKIIWPGPPERPRIQYLWTLSITGRTGKAGSKGLLDFLAGESSGYETDPRASNSLLRPYSIFVDDRNNLYIADTGAYRVTIINLDDNTTRHIVRAGKTELVSPVGVAVDREGKIFVSDSVLRRVFIFAENGKIITELKGVFSRPTCVAVDSNLSLVYVADTVAHKILVYSTDGEKISEIGRNGSLDGEFNFPTHIWVDRNGFLYVTDAMNFRIQIFTPAGVFFSSFGTLGDSYGHLDKPKGIATDSAGNIYVVDSIKDMVKIYNRDGLLLLFFGSEGDQYGQFWLPSGIYIDQTDTIYVADTYNKRIQAFRYLGNVDH